jgi:hypothetical protein
MGAGPHQKGAGEGVSQCLTSPTVIVEVVVARAGAVITVRATRLTAGMVG